MLVNGNVIDDRLAESGAVNPVVGGIFVAFGQILACRKIWALARTTTDRVDIDRVARSLRDSEWSFSFTLVGAGTHWSLLLAAPPSPPLFVLFLIPIMALLLECIHIGWAYRSVNDRAEQGAVAETVRLSSGTARRIRTLQSITTGIHTFLSGIAVALLAATIVTEAPPASMTALVQFVAVAAVAMVPLLPIRGVLLMRAAIVDHTVHLPTLRRARASFVRAGISAVPLTAVAVAALAAAPADPHVAAGRTTLVFIALVLAWSHFVELDRLLMGDIPRRFRRKA
jgi:hypothetical protein